MGRHGRQAPARRGPQRRDGRQAAQRGGHQGDHPRGGFRHPGAAGRRHPRPGHDRALPRRWRVLRDHRHRGGEEPGLPARGVRRISRPHHRGVGREGRQGGDRRLVEAHRARRGRPRQALPGLRRRGGHLHRHRPRRHDDRREHRGHGAPRAGARRTRHRERRARQHGRRARAARGRVRGHRGLHHGARHLRRQARRS